MKTAAVVMMINIKLTLLLGLGAVMLRRKRNFEDMQNGAVPEKLIVPLDPYDR
jgi:hypothetical protein